MRSNLHPEQLDLARRRVLFALDKLTVEEPDKTKHFSERNIQTALLPGHLADSHYGNLHPPAILGDLLGDYISRPENDGIVLLAEVKQNKYPSKGYRTNPEKREEIEKILSVGIDGL